MLQVPFFTRLLIKWVHMSRVLSQTGQIHCFYRVPLSIQTLKNNLIVYVRMNEVFID